MLMPASPPSPSLVLRKKSHMGTESEHMGVRQNKRAGRDGAAVPSACLCCLSAGFSVCSPSSRHFSSGRFTGGAMQGLILNETRDVTKSPEMVS